MELSPRARDIVVGKLTHVSMKAGDGSWSRRLLRLPIHVFLASNDIEFNGNRKSWYRARAYNIEFLDKEILGDDDIEPRSLRTGKISEHL
jgi:hypothetical protein